MPPSAVLQTLGHLWRTLEPLGAPMAVMGGLALAVWKHPRSTLDVDLMIAVDTAEPVFARLTADGFRPVGTEKPRPLAGMRISQWLFEPDESYVDVEVDLLLVDSDYHRQALSRAIPVQLSAMLPSIRFFTCEDLILHKLVADRLIDRADIEVLIERNRETLDLGYLRRWANVLGVAADLEACLAR